MKPEITDKLADLKKYVGLLAEYRKKSREEIARDMTLRGAVERYLQLAIETVLEIGEMIIAAEALKKPETYREVIEILGNEGVIEKRFAQKLAPIAGLRNMLIHRYDEIDIEELCHHLRHDLGDFDSFAKQVAAYVGSR